MTTQTQLRQAFARDLPRLADPAQNAWLIKGDFDRFKLINDLYGCLLTDYLLDWSIEALVTTLEAYQKRWGVGPFLWNVIGDDVTIYLPPSTLAAADVAQLLHGLRHAIRESFQQRYSVCALPFPADFFSQVPPARLEALKSDLEQDDRVLDFAPRHQGFLLLSPLAAAGHRQQVADEVRASIAHHTGRRVPAVPARPDWLYNPADFTCHTFNAGWVYPPSISFAACSARRGMAGETGSPQDSLAWFERLAGACQATLKRCKQERSGVALEENGLPLADAPSSSANSPSTDALSQLHWASERCLREKLYFRRLERPLLFQLNPVYCFPSGAQAECLPLEKYRGNAYGIGLKGINELCGQSRANSLIRQLILAFSQGLQDVLGKKGIPPAQVWTALFVDRFSVFGERVGLPFSEIAALGRDWLTAFNAASEEMRMAQVRLSVVDSPSPLPGYVLMHRLALAQLAPSPTALACADERLDARRFCRRLEQQGHLALEAQALSGARQLSAWSGEGNFFEVRRLVQLAPAPRWGERGGDLAFGGG